MSAALVLLADTPLGWPDAFAIAIGAACFTTLLVVLIIRNT